MFVHIVVVCCVIGLAIGQILFNFELTLEAKTHAITLITHSPDSGPK